MLCLVKYGVYRGSLPPNTSVTHRCARMELPSGNCTETLKHFVNTHGRNHAHLWFLFINYQRLARLKRYYIESNFH